MVCIQDRRRFQSLSRSPRSRRAGLAYWLRSFNLSEAAAAPFCLLTAWHPVRNLGSWGPSAASGAGLRPREPPPRSSASAASKAVIARVHDQGPIMACRPRRRSPRAPADDTLAVLVAGSHWYGQAAGSKRPDDQPARVTRPPRWRRDPSAAWPGGHDRTSHNGAVPCQASSLQRGRDGGELLVQLMDEPFLLPGVEVGAGSMHPLIPHGRP